ncbi:MAG TPA: hydroxyacylglutathione hydrolase [Mariprofundaceae bacterium]|nr:hydroxyacylglutathione hydrolase [Mariprofundaceae bacterium]
MWSYQHLNFSVHQLPALNDNYIYLIQDHNSEVAAVVDPADASPVVQACKQLEAPLTHILNTHHHWDHTDGNKPLKSRFAATVIGAEVDAVRIPEIDTSVSESSELLLGSLKVEILFVPGHTVGHIAYLIDDALFCGDTLFGGGCGRLFEGSVEQMWSSLTKLAALPDETSVYCAHEYTLANLRFARGVDPDNHNLIRRISNDTQKRMQQLPTIPTTISMEKQTNPFLRPLNAGFCRLYAEQHGIDNTPVAVFSHLRASKDRI